jgi:hypothetical protein
MNIFNTPWDIKKSVLIVLLFGMSCTSKENVSNEQVSDSASDSSSSLAVDPSLDHLLPTHTFDYNSTYEVQFQSFINSLKKDTITREGFLGFSTSLVIKDKQNIVLRGEEEKNLKFVMFNDSVPLLKIINSNSVTFTNIDFNNEFTPDLFHSQKLISIEGSSNISFINCNFTASESIMMSDSEIANATFTNCNFYSTAGQDEAQEDNPVLGNEGDGDNTIEETPSFPNDWSANVNTLSIPHYAENEKYFDSNEHFQVNSVEQMTYSAYAVLDFARDFLKPVNWKQENSTWQTGMEIRENIPATCPDFEKVISLTETRKKLWYIHRKLTESQEYDASGTGDRWKDDSWYKNRSYYNAAFKDRTADGIETFWKYGKVFLSDNVELKKPRKDALLFIDELLLYYVKIKQTPYYKEKFRYLQLSELNLVDGEYFYQTGFAPHSNECMRTGYTDGNYITGYDWGNESWMYSFWLRRTFEGNSENVKDILLWAKSKLEKK